MNLNENLDKLPKWAQSEVRNLKMRLEEAKNTITTLNDAPPSNTVRGHGYSLGDEPIFYLKNNETVTFKLPNGIIHVRIEDNYLDINAHSEFSHYLFSRPVASNSLEIHFIKQ